MKDSPLSLPKQKNYEYSLGLAYEVACEQLSGIDVDRQCRNCGATYNIVDSKKIVILPYLNCPCNIVIPDGTVSFADSGEDIPMREKLLVLHYLIHARGTPLSNKLVSSRDIPDVKNYFRTFFKRVLQPINTSFGKDPQTLLNAGKAFGGEMAGYGDMAVTIPAFERVPVTFIVWQGDNEFPAEGNIMFDSTIADYLPSEDIIVLSEILTWKLIKSLKK